MIRLNTEHGTLVFCRGLSFIIGSLELFHADMSGGWGDTLVEDHGDRSVNHGDRNHQERKPELLCKEEK